MVVKTVNLKVVREEHFEKTEKGGMGVTREGVKKICEAFEREMAVFLVAESSTLRQQLVAQIALLKNWVDENAPLQLLYNKPEGKAVDLKRGKTSAETG